jgi:hypothetical protein
MNKSTLWGDIARSLVMAAGASLVANGTLTTDSLAAAATAISTVVGGVAVLVSIVLSARAHKVQAGDLSRVGSAILLAGVLGGTLLLGACNTVGGSGVATFATDKRIAQAEAVLAAGNALAQTFIADGTISAKAAPKVQAAIDGASLALGQARKALADGKLDAADAIEAAIVAATRVPAILAELQR